MFETFRSSIGYRSSSLWNQLQTLICFNINQQIPHIHSIIKMEMMLFLWFVHERIFYIIFFLEHTRAIKSHKMWMIEDWEKKNNKLYNEEKREQLTFRFFSPSILYLEMINEIILSPFPSSHTTLLSVLSVSSQAHILCSTKVIRSC
jgi:uncharacterized ion transporter superfamily protein YfcC